MLNTLYFYVLRHCVCSGAAPCIKPVQQVSVNDTVRSMPFLLNYWCDPLAPSPACI